MEYSRTIKIGSRKSMLAKLQAYEVGAALQQKFPKLKVQYITIDAQGDQDKKSALSSFSSTGIFTKVVTEKLTAQEIATPEIAAPEIDCAVHSWKDLPTADSADTAIVATLPRADISDVLLINKELFAKAAAINSLSSFTVLTSSPRRTESIKEFLQWGLPFEIKNITVTPIRGNVDTRLNKLISGEGDALILAKAGIDRLLSDLNTDATYKKSIRALLSKAVAVVLPLEVFPAAPGQGALAIEVLQSNAELISLFKAINCEATYKSVLNERRFLQAKGGGCHSKLGASSIPHEAGEIFFYQYEDDTKQLKRAINVEKLNADSELLSKTESSVFSFKNNGVEILRRPLINQFYATEYSDYNGVFITKECALPESSQIRDAWKKISQAKDSVKHPVVWTSGVQSWKKLAKTGVLINGCFNSLGDFSQPSFDSFVDEEIKNQETKNQAWVKLTHSNGNDVAWATKLATYEVQYRCEENAGLRGSCNLTDYKQFYWASFNEFLWCYEKEKTIIAEGNQHYCGAGSTYKRIKEFLETTKARASVNILL